MGQFTNHLPQFNSCARIQTGRRLVQDQDTWIMNHRATEAKSLLHPLGVAADFLAGSIEKLECVEVNNVANFDCIGCRKHQFVYDMSVKLVGTQTKKDGARGVILLLQRRLVTKALIC